MQATTWAYNNSIVVDFATIYIASTIVLYAYAFIVKAWETLRDIYEYK